MNIRYLVDTDGAIHYMHGRPDVVQRLTDLRPQGLGPSVVSLAELYEGVYYSRDPEGSGQDLRNFLGAVRLVGADEDVCMVFGRERGRLRAANKLMGDFDLPIGATALRYGLTLATNNRRHFEMIEGLALISV